MDREIRHSWPARIVALGFIGSVLVGNIWLTHVLLGTQPSSWVQAVFVATTLVVFCGGLGLLALILRGIWMRRFAPPSLDADDEG